ncbi:hypothetical protein EAH_00005600 [Eimeria acervulina]|uniref:Uncharacterized protein n=1 Tax=Eimeria acervulina TaxID=5801 RepID=U6GE16_EIMAC|nr:hypothetical protein EAH_00005600 [Eimeria acervulina]CDI77782.1 hypothetical protein EAH_00005600 [Eimeria acervulina]
MEAATAAAKPLSGAAAAAAAAAAEASKKGQKVWPWPGRGKEGEYWAPNVTSTTLWQADFSLLFEWSNEVSVHPKRKRTTTIGSLGT